MIKEQIFLGSIDIVSPVTMTTIDRSLLILSTSVILKPNLMITTLATNLT